MCWCRQGAALTCTTPCFSSSRFKAASPPPALPPPPGVPAALPLPLRPGNSLPACSSSLARSCSVLAGLRPLIIPARLAHAMLRTCVKGDQVREV